MRKFFNNLIFYVGLLFSASVVAGGSYDGIWKLNTGANIDQDYMVVYQNGDTLLVVQNYGEVDGWEAWMGQFSTENLVTVRSVINDDNVNTAITIHFITLTTATFTLDSCTPAIACDLPLGVALGANKIF